MLGVAVLASIFSSYGGYASGQRFVDGMRPALWIGFAVLAAASLAAYALPNKRRRTEPVVAAANARRGFPHRSSGRRAARLPGDGRIVAVRPTEPSRRSASGASAVR